MNTIFLNLKGVALKIFFELSILVHISRVLLFPHLWAVDPINQPVFVCEDRFFGQIAKKHSFQILVCQNC